MITQREALEQATEQAQKVLRGVENEDIQGLALAYYNTQLEIIDQVEKSFTAETWSLDTMQGGRAASLFRQVNDALARLKQKVNLDTEQALYDQMIGSRAWTAYALDQATPPDVRIQAPMIPEPAIRAIVNTPFQGAMFSQRYANITDQVASDIQGQLIQSMMNGESMDKAGARVAEILGATEDADEMSDFSYEGLRIARTEIMRAQNLGRESVYAANEDIMDGESEWLVTADDKLCPWCLRRNGMTDSEIQDEDPPEADPFFNSATKPLHPHCRCTSLPRLKSWADLGIDMPEGVDDTEMGMRNQDGDWVTVPQTAFEEWIKTRGAELGLEDVAA